MYYIATEVFVNTVSSQDCGRWTSEHWMIFCVGYHNGFFVVLSSSELAIKLKFPLYKTHRDEPTRSLLRSAVIAFNIAYLHFQCCFMTLCF